jgi:serine/threonine protein kinase/tetratricopeptide (TPR) repeat protein
MSLDELSASELSRIDAICLQYETNLRNGQKPDISEIVARQGGQNAEVLRHELELVFEELENSPADPPETEVGSGGKYFGPAALPSAGVKIGRYVVEDMLGRGGMGVVFKAFDELLDRTVAIKMLAVEIAKRRDLTERFEREARAVAAISHPNIVELFDVGASDGLPYAVMEYLDGELLDARLKRGAMDAGEVRRIGAQIADALATAHEANVVHRDLKPHNIMLVRRSGGEAGGSASASEETETEGAASTIAKLFDFGLSRVPSRGLGESADESGDGIILGTPGYMAPEQTRGEVVTPAADIFSLGCVLYEAFYGKRAFAGRTKASLFAATLYDDPQPDPIRRRDDVDLADLIQSCLQKDAKERPQSAASIAKRLRHRGPVHNPIMRQAESGYSHGQVTRRRLLELVGGGMAGAAFGAIFTNGAANELTQIDSIAVLSFMDDSPGTHSSANPMPDGVVSMTPPPVGDMQLRRGEQLAALLVHELTRLSEVKVPRFRPFVAETPGEFREIGATLEVDALVSGNMRTVKQGSKEFLELDIQIVSAKTGNELWGKRIQTDSGDNLLEQSKLATEIASVIGHRLTSTAAEVAPPSVESFHCLVDGKTRSDPDSLRGLEMALMCFQKAHDIDRRFADAIAGISLTSITLAAQTGTEKSVELIRQARESSAEALQLDPKSIDARLAAAMLDWQTVGRYQQADRAFQELVMIAPNNWQVRHQYGLLQLATGRTLDALRSLREASQLNPLSVSVKVDLARAQWYRGNQERAIQDALRIRDRYDDSLLAKGILVDLYEHQARYADAAAEHQSFELPPAATANEYFQERRLRLEELPYGPFGDAVNQAILQTRSAEGIDDLALAELTDPMPPMLTLVLAAHPSFGPVRLLPRAKEILPSEMPFSSL